MMEFFAVQAGVGQEEKFIITCYEAQMKGYNMKQLNPFYENN